MSLSITALGCAFGLASRGPITFTAFHALKIAERRLRPEVRNNLICISSPPTDASLVPDAWRFSFIDQATRGRVRSVIVAAHSSSEHPDVQEAFRSRNGASVAPSKPIRETKTVLDSDQALARVRSASNLQDYSSASYQLFIEKDGGLIWHLSFYKGGESPMVCFRLNGRTGTLLPMQSLVGSGRDGLLPAKSVPSIGNRRKRPFRPVSARR